MAERSTATTPHALVLRAVESFWTKAEQVVTTIEDAAGASLLFEQGSVL
jgi:hypothetical protein